MAPSAPAKTYIDPTAIVAPSAVIGPGTKIWAFSQIGEHAVIGSGCVIANGAYIDRYVKLGNRVRVHNKALLYHGLIVEDDVFIGPGAVFTNDRRPRSGQTRDLEGISWKVGKGASIGANVTVLPDVDIGPGAMVGAGSLVAASVPAHALVFGNPARIHGVLCACGGVAKIAASSRLRSLRCPDCRKSLKVPKKAKGPSRS